MLWESKNYWEENREHLILPRKVGRIPYLREWVIWKSLKRSKIIQNRDNIQNEDTGMMLHGIILKNHESPLLEGVTSVWWVGQEIIIISKPGNVKVPSLYAIHMCLEESELVWNNVYMYFTLSIVD